MAYNGDYTRCPRHPRNIIANDMFDGLCPDCEFEKDSDDYMFTSGDDGECEVLRVIRDGKEVPNQLLEDAGTLSPEATPQTRRARTRKG